MLLHSILNKIGFFAEETFQWVMLIGLIGLLMGGVSGLLKNGKGIIFKLCAMPLGMYVLLGGLYQAATSTVVFQQIIGTLFLVAFDLTIVFILYSLVREYKNL